MKVIQDHQILSKQIAPTEDGEFMTLVYPLKEPLKAGNHLLQLIPDGTEWTPPVVEIRLMK